MQINTANPTANKEFFSTRKNFDQNDRDLLSEKTINKKLKKFESESRLILNHRSNNFSKRALTYKGPVCC